MCQLRFAVKKSITENKNLQNDKPAPITPLLPEFRSWYIGNFGGDYSSIIDVTMEYGVSIRWSIYTKTGLRIRSGEYSSQRLRYINFQPDRCTYIDAGGQSTAFYYYNYPQYYTITEADLPLQFTETTFIPLENNPYAPYYINGVLQTH